MNSNFSTRRTRLSSRRGQSLLEFIIVFPIFVLVLFGMMQVYEKQLYQQKISATLWYILRGSTYDFDHHTENLSSIVSNASSLFASGQVSTQSSWQTEGTPSYTLDDDRNFGDTYGADNTSSGSSTFSDSKGTTVKIVVDENTGGLGALAIMSAVNPLDISLVRRAQINVTARNLFHGLPNPFLETGFGSLLDVADETITYTGEGRVWASWTAIVNKPNVNKSDRAKYAGYTHQDFSKAKAQIQAQYNELRKKQSAAQKQADYYRSQKPPQTDKANAAQAQANDYKKQADSLEKMLQQM